MIHRVFANQPGFREVRFTAGMNVVLAERTKEATKKDSRNGLGKTTLLEIVHFCLGSRGDRLDKDVLADWEFGINLDLAGKTVTVVRAVATPKTIHVQGDFADWPIQPRQQDDSTAAVLDAKDWTAVLGTLMFGLPLPERGQKYLPTFRSLITYFARRGRDAFSTPFEHYRKQNEWDKQLHVAFLLNLAWEDARDVQLLRDKAGGLRGLKSAVKSGVVAGFGDSRGDLEDRRIHLEELVEQEAERLSTFRVHPQYQQIQDAASALTEKIHTLANHNYELRQLVDLYERDMQAEEGPDQREVERLYAEAGVALGEAVKQHLEAVKAFHESVVSNRRDFLEEESQRARREMADNEAELKQLSDQRADHLSILQTHGALEEYTKLQTAHAAVVSQLNQVRAMLANLNKLEAGQSELKIEQELLHQRGRRDYEEREAIRKKAVSLFNGNSQFLYKAPGRLLIDFEKTGFKFAVEIERDGSDGIENMKIFCFDLMVAQLWSTHDPSPGFLFHDSRIFDADSRQRAMALELAASESRERGFQYICTLNSDSVPEGDFTEGFDLSQYIRLTLTDDAPEGSLLGFRF